MCHWIFSLLSHWPELNKMAMNKEANEAEKCSHLHGWPMYNKPWDFLNKNNGKVDIRKEGVTSVTVVN